MIKSKHVFIGAVAAVAIGVGVAAPAAAAGDPLTPVTAFVAGAAVGDIAAPQGMTTQTLIAARNAGLPIYEAVVTKEYQAPKAAYVLTEYRRVYDINVLSSPTAKFVGVGAVAPDTFWVRPGSLASPIVVNLRETWQENVGFPLMRWDPTPLKFTNSPLVRLPDGGPSVGIALVT
ncbi:hypothetical protein ACGFIU_05195 [Rhodococcus oryzae]|uniref:hypothetical protein n=1 Tax=Rhodococcus TaxID=1827 RepID=UPI00097930A9|nr:hypothetical protein [Rhodococcus sp. MTM3W5.2]AQA20977.1 hypothetical protein BTZ20_1944 [Rhodococcus sp. MTM3W5.2]